MKPLPRVLPALLLSLFAGAAIPAANAAQFSNVVVFGDSLSDSGYYRPFLAGLGLPAPLVATLGRFTTNPGPVWSELVGQYYGAATAPSNAGGWNFAQGGATVASNSPSTPPGFAQRPVSTQIGEYLARNGGSADRDALFAMWAGGNDFLNNFTLYSLGQITQAQLQANFLAAATAEVGQVGRLVTAGARYVVVFTLPDIGFTPYAQAAGPVAAGAATQLSAGYNTTLLIGLASSGLRVIPVDVFTLFNEIRANPGLYGFTNTTGIACGPFPPITTSGNAQFCYSGNLVAPNADQTYVFADSVHPTTGTHKILANFVTALIEGPIAYSMLAEVPLRTRSAHVQTLSDGLMNGQASGVGEIAAFAAGAGGSFDVDQTRTGPGAQTDNSALSVGVTMRASESVTVGGAIGSSRAKANYANGLGGFDTRETQLSIFAGLKSGGFYLNGAATIADIDFSNSRRNIVLGPATRIATASPTGSNASAFFTTGYDFALGHFLIGPVAAWTTQDVDVSGFEESGAGSANLRMASQKRRSDVASFGVRASMTLGAFTPYLKYTADKELKDQERLVTATPVSMAAGNSYDLPAYQPADSTFGTITVGVRGMLSEYVGFGLNYVKVTGRGEVKEDSISGTISIRF